MDFYRINEADLSHNCFDDEIIVVQLELGTYYSLHHSARVIWQALERSPQSSESLSSLFEDAPADAVHEIQEFLDALKHQQLVVDAPAADAVPLQAAALESTSYTSPQLEAFDDLQELLLADIIHDTDEQGWPHLRNAELGDHESEAAA